MKPRLNPYQAAPDPMKAVAALDTYVKGSGLDPGLIELIKMRASQINGCAYCLHMHSRVPDEVYEEARRHFSEEELVKLTVAVGAINAWNRIAISFRAVHPIRKAQAA